MIEAILPNGVCVASRRKDDETDDLFPEEAVVVQNSVPKRCAEFATGRRCAREALACLGLPRQSIPQTAGGAPLWPPGTVGSITHCASYRACAVAYSDQFFSIGVDAELNVPLRPGLLCDIASASERRELAALATRHASVNWDRLIFCTKEAVYKTWFPLTGTWLGFEDAKVRFDPVGGTFVAQLGPEAPPHLARMAGRWAVCDGVLLAAIALPSREPVSAEEGSLAVEVASTDVRGED